VWAVILVIATGPLRERLAKNHPALRGPLALPLLFTLALALVVILPVALGVAEAARERADVLNWFASARANGVPEPAWIRQFPMGADYLSRWWQANLGTPVAASRELTQLHATAVHQTRLVGPNILHRAVVFGLALVAYFFLLRDQEPVVAQLKIAGDRMLGPTGERVARQIVQSVRGTINGLVFVGLGEGALMTIVYGLAGAPHPLVLGGVTAVAAMIPFGAILVFGVAALLVLAGGSAFGAAAILLVGLVVVGIADHLVRPALIGGATRLPFLLVLFGILGGVETLGLLGLFVGPAVMAALVMLWRDYVSGSAPPGRSVRHGRESQ
jgi:predicted PurR-regulated permease PerM